MLTLLIVLGVLFAAYCGKEIMGRRDSDPTELQDSGRRYLPWQ